MEARVLDMCCKTPAKTSVGKSGKRYKFSCPSWHCVRVLKPANHAGWKYSNISSQYQLDEQNQHPQRITRTNNPSLSKAGIPRGRNMANFRMSTICMNRTGINLRLTILQHTALVGRERKQK
jgi:hypothetical protein